ncbi:MAG: 30S ribosomal protein S18 [Nitrospirota bacterium]
MRTAPVTSSTAPSSGPSRGGDAKQGAGASSERKFFGRRKACRFCTDKVVAINYKDVSMLRNYLTERGKIMPRRLSGNCARHQRELTMAIKRARNIALVAFAEER